MSTDSTLPPLPPKVGSTKLLFGSKWNRDAHFRKLKRNGIVAKRGSVEDQMIHPNQVTDFKSAIEHLGPLGGGLDNKPCFFPILYTLEF